MKLYEITEAMADLERMLDEGVPEDQLADTIEDMKGDFKEKAESILYILTNMNSQADAYKAEEKRLSDKRKSTEKQIERLKEYLLFNMQELNSGEINNGIMSASIRKGAPVLVISDEDLIPVEWKEIKTTVSTDKRGLLKALKDGEVVEGAEVGTGKNTLTIK